MRYGSYPLSLNSILGLTPVSLRLVVWLSVCCSGYPGYSAGHGGDSAGGAPRGG
ncbi:hypothetical protein F511_39620 [Dorcoceras hygrometricum]|uniref:Uncharacterized protein n=1 Tax=Dorcoceras hygrometricum TaxID=472368 RepID=A0A2Z7D4Y0_9LAMI|nr:hypothetical protein F511_39620 [Dorcoceras hygrometricum]